MAIITKYSDYRIHSIEYFIDAIETEIAYRDIQGLTNNRIKQINVTKEHPLVSLVSAQLSETSRTDILRSGLLPAISVTPGTIIEEAFTLGQCYKSEIVDSDFIDELKAYLDKTNKQIQDNLLITPTQIELIIAEYNRAETNGVKAQTNEWGRKEEINISVWNDSPDLDILFGNLIDSVLATIQVGFVGDRSSLRDFKYTITKGLTNFNFGRTLFGTEYTITFYNSFNNFIIYSDDVIEGHEFTPTFQIPGDE